MSFLNRTRNSRCATLAALLCLAGGPAWAQRAEHAEGLARTAAAHEHLDARFAHNRYYLDQGYAVRRPPAGGVGELRGLDGGRYWFHDGNWYRWRDRQWIVGRAPIGLFVPYLPTYFTTVWWLGVPYYYANDAYYLWNEGEHGYEVVDPPDGIASVGSTQTPASDRLFIYPKNGQSQDQQATDRYECHRWAVDQTGYDPTAAVGAAATEQSTGKRSDYFRAQSSCLEGRGYTVK